MSAQVSGHGTNVQLPRLNTVDFAGPVPSPEDVFVHLEALLSRASEVKTETTILPLLPAEPFRNALAPSSIWKTSLQDDRPVPELDPENSQQRETLFLNIAVAARRLVYSVTTTTAVQDPRFVRVWNLLDLTLYSGNDEQCDSGLMSTIVEELLDGNSISDCHLIFQYLESRREPFTVKRYEAMHTRNLVTLRSCSELLRRLSRAEDAVFCGRVFIFLFQTLPPGERGWANHKGEFNTENVTTFQLPPLDGAAAEGKADSTDNIVKEKGRKKRDINDVAALRELYPAFWSMQTVFANPLLVSDQGRFSAFKSSLRSTLEWFRSTQNVTRAEPSSFSGLEGVENIDEIQPDLFNLKYLTSFDLFKLELRDLKFQRNILVQALIFIDFLLSLTPEAKLKSQSLPNKSVQYGYTLSDEDAKWAQDMRTKIATYLQLGPDGKFYYRMVDSVLSLDKNWVDWKLNSCPVISKEAITPEEFLESRDKIEDICRVARMRPVASGAMNFSFLEDDEQTDSLLQEPRDYPGVEAALDKALMAELDLDFADDEDEKNELEEKKSTAVWYSMRLSASENLSRLGKIKSGMSVNEIRAVLLAEEGEEEEEPAAEGSDKVADVTMVDSTQVQEPAGPNETVADLTMAG